MTDSTQRFISELIRAANEVEKLWQIEKTNLLFRSAATITDMREQIGMSGTPANDGRKGDIVHRLREAGKNAGGMTDDQVSAALLEAVEIIKVCKVLLDARREIEAE